MRRPSIATGESPWNGTPFNKMSPEGATELVEGDLGRPFGAFKLLLPFEPRVSPAAMLDRRIRGWAKAFFDRPRLLGRFH